MASQLNHDDTQQDVVHVIEQGNIGILLLNKPSSLNALNLEMIQIIRQALRDWENRSDIKCVILEGAGERAFCAGGDIKANYMARQDNEQTGEITNDFAAGYFKEEYELDLELYEYSKPLVCFMKGITMGGGYGLAAPCDFRIACEDSIFAMPEVGIGLYPDVGAIYFLSRLRNYIGYYLALTGTIINATDMLGCGFASHIVNKHKIDGIRDRLAVELNDLNSNDAIKTKIKSIIEEFSIKRSALDTQSIIDPHIEIINECFGSDTVQNILNDLERLRNEWAQKQLEIIKTKSPHSLVLTHAYLKNYADRSYPDVLLKDYELSMYCMGHPDYYEGVRAQVVDKDKNPQWKPARLEDVDLDKIADYFN